MMRYGNSMMGDYGYGLGGHPGFGLVCMALQAVFWIVVIVFLFKMYHSKKSKALKESKDSTSNDSALAILRDRYAKGEIDTEEFNQRKNDLQL